MSQKNASIQMLRGIAASMVAMSHLVYWIGACRHAPFLLGKIGLIGFGGAGVDIFFVISGFIMMTTTRNAGGTIEASLFFLMKRINRIYPAYWVWSIVLFAIWLTGALPVLREPNPAYLVASLMLFPYKNEYGTFHPWMDPGWTLSFEVFFYIVFALALLSSRAVSKIVFLLFAFALLHGLGLLFSQGSAFRYLFSSDLIFEFIFGAAAALIIQTAFWRRIVTFRLMPEIGLLVAFTILFFAWPSGYPRAVASGIPAFFIVLFASGVSLPGNFVTRRLVYLGDTSYSIYLTHVFFIYLLAWALDRGWFSVIGSTWLAIASLPVVVGSASLAYFAVERPLGRIITITPNPASRPEAVKIS
jgi:peptidoglycan/LPS O-acetylase OafA/YrhL